MTTPQKIAFVSCAYATHRPVQPAWRQILDAKPDLLLMLGDNAYMDWAGSLNWDFEALEKCYREQFDVSDFNAVIKSVPTLAIWDDHDCGPNDTFGAEAPPEKLAKTRALFDKWMGFAVNNNRPNMYCSYEGLADVKVLMLDVRTFRTRASAKPPVLLGVEQEKWLWKQLDPVSTPQKRITIIGSGSVFSIGKGPDRVVLHESVAEGLKSRLAFRPGGGTDIGRRALFLGGDVHYNAFHTHAEGFHEAISSGVACFKPRTESEAQFVPENYADNWGLITIDESQVRIDFHANALATRNPRPQIIDTATWAAKEA
jgi:hypothetical protein